MENHANVSPLALWIGAVVLVSLAAVAIVGPVEPDTGADAPSGRELALIFAGLGLLRLVSGLIVSSWLAAALLPTVFWIAALAAQEVECPECSGVTDVVGVAGAIVGALGTLSPMIIGAAAGVVVRR